MDQAFVLKLIRDGLVLILLLSAPSLVIALLVGVFISVMQAATQIQEQTLTFVPKIVSIFIIILITASWMMDTLISFTTNLFSQLPNFVR